jgi:hypothetical protein
MEWLYMAGGGVVLVAAIAGWMLGVRRSNGTKPSVLVDSGTEFTLKPVLSESEARFYNLLKLAVGDRYLILAHVPLWCVVSVPMPETGSPVPLLTQLALKRATFVLLHPGSRRAEKVVDWKGEGGNGPLEERTDPLLEAVLRSTGVQLVTVHASETHTVADLVALFDLAEDE